MTSFPEHGYLMKPPPPQCLPRHGRRMNGPDLGSRERGNDTAGHLPCHVRCRRHLANERGCPSRPVGERRSCRPERGATTASRTVSVQAVPWVDVIAVRPNEANFSIGMAGAGSKL